MGGGGSKKAQLLDRHGQLFSSQEKEAIQACFLAISRSEEAESFTEDQFKVYLSNPHTSQLLEIASGLFGVFPEKIPPRVSFGDFVLYTSHLLHGSYSQRSVFFHELCTNESTLTLDHLQDTLSTFLQVVLTSELGKQLFHHANSFNHDPKALSLLISYFLQPLRERLQSSASTDDSAAPLAVPSHELEWWLTHSGLAVRIFEVGLAFCFYRVTLLEASTSNSPSAVLSYVGLDRDAFTGEILTERLLLPLKIQHPLIRESFNSKLLDQASLILLNNHLTPENRGRFFPLFSSAHHGESFSTFVKQLVACNGPSIFVVRDKGGNVFGGCVTESWQITSQFSGNANCFLFKLYPEMGVYTSTGYNSNFMYLQQNAQTLPNGLGMGGQLEYFGLWLAADFGKGHSKAKPKCSTFGSPMLSSTEEFEIDTLELWGVGSPVLPDEEEESSTKPSILDVDMGATAMLKLAGRKIHSEDIREIDKENSEKDMAG